MRVVIRRCFKKRIVEYLKGRGVERYTIYKLNNPFLFCWLDLKKLNINFPRTPYFQYITIESWGPVYDVFFYDSEGKLATCVNIGFTEKSVIEYFNELLLNISQLKGGEHNG